MTGVTYVIASVASAHESRKKYVQIASATDAITYAMVRLRRLTGGRS